MGIREKGKQVKQKCFKDHWKCLKVKRFLKGVKPLVLYDVDRGVVMEPMQGKLEIGRASCRERV